MTYEKRKLMKIKLLAGSLQIFSHVKSLQTCDEVETSFWFIVLEKETEAQNISEQLCFAGNALGLCKHCF